MMAKTSSVSGSLIIFLPRIHTAVKAMAVICLVLATATIFTSRLYDKFTTNIRISLSGWSEVRQLTSFKMLAPDEKTSSNNKPRLKTQANNDFAGDLSRTGHSSESMQVSEHTTSQTGALHATCTAECKKSETSSPSSTQGPQLVEALGLKSLYNNLYRYSRNSSIMYFSKSKLNPKSCSDIPPNLVGQLNVTKAIFPLNDVSQLGFHLSPGGSYSPFECTAPQSVAIVIPYRNRPEHLSTILLNMHPFLQKQQRDYTIFIVNQTEGSKFNRAILMNIGAVEALKRKHYDCLVFHDVDLVPENDRNLYECPEGSSVRHLSASIDRHGYKLPYSTILGGATAMRWDLFLKINGFSNQFFGWGGEDDDLYKRCHNMGVKVVRYPQIIARYTNLNHNRDEGNEKNPKRFAMLSQSASRQPRDGLNSLTYKLNFLSEETLYTHINVDINQTEVMNAKPGQVPRFPFQELTTTTTTKFPTSVN